MPAPLPEPPARRSRPPVPPVIPSGQEIYDAIMSQIEPELMSANLPLLAEKYKDETPEQVAERVARYDRAFDEYDRLEDEYFQKAEEAVRQNYRQAKESLEGEDREGEQRKLDQIEEIFTTAK